MSRAAALPFAVAALVAAAIPAAGEPIFLSRQYTRCTTCHFSPAGGGLLTPYGRSLAREELSTTGKSRTPPANGGGPAAGWDLADDRFGPVSAGIEVRPAHLDVRFDGGHVTRDFLMTADVIAAYRAHEWTVYGELGRQPRLEGTKIDSYEYWVAHQGEKGLGVRVGRFLPAYGIGLADHTAFTRAPLGLDTYDQVYGLEVSDTGEHHLLQLTAAPGRADSILHDDGRRAFTGAGRLQFDLSPRSVLVLSGLYRGTSRLTPRNGAGGVAFGFAPASRISTWTEFDAQVQQGATGPPAYTLLNETGWEAYRGVWLKLSPQLRTDLGNTAGGVFRLAFEANVLPRTRWNVDLSFYRDRGRATGLVTRTLLAQLHLYL